MFKKNELPSYILLVIMALCLLGAAICSANYSRALAFLLSAFASAELVIEFSPWSDQRKKIWNRILKVILLLGSLIGALLFKHLV